MRVGAARPARSIFWAALWLLVAACAGFGPRPAPTAFPPVERGLTATADVQSAVLETARPPAVGSPAPPYELATGQHISADGGYTATETEAAGAMICQVERDSCAFNYLVSLDVPGLRFWDEEQPPYRGEDHLVHPAMVQPLARLVDLVTAEWAGEYSLVVTDAYDSLLEHDLAQSESSRKYSLHFEGRSIDLILSPGGLERLPRLCALAHLAGFAWVHNEDDHCHASARADSLCNICSGRRAP